MKKLKKFVCVAMASAMALAMAGCGSDGSGSGNGSSSGSESGSSSGSESGSSSGSASGSGNADANTFKIGGTGPLTGDAAAYGQAVRNAAQLAVDEINANGGVNGYMLELNYQDDEHDPEKAVNAYNTLKDWGVQIVMGSVTSKPCIAVGEKTKEDNIFQLTPSGTAVECTQYDNAFRVCFSDPAQGTVSAQYIGENQLATKIAIIYNSSDVYSSGIYENFAKEAEKYSFEIVCAEAFTDDSKTDFSVQLQKAKEAGADMVFLPMYYQEASTILTQAKGMDFAPAFFGVDGMDGILSGVDNFDASLAEDVMFLTPFASTSTETNIVNFVTAYEEKFGETPNQFAADAYDGIYIIKALLEQSGAKPSDDVSAICEGLKKAMGEISFDGLTGSGITWSADGEPDKAPSVVVIKGGVYQQL